MTYTSYPFDGKDTTEAQYSALFRELQDSAVVGAYASTGLAVTGNSTGMSVSLAPGAAIVRGFFFNNDAIAQLTIPVASTTARYDAVILRLDPASDSIIPVVVTNAGQTPVLTQTDTGIFEILLAVVAVAANAVTIAAGNVTDMRQFVGSRTGVWSTATRPVNPRPYRLGMNTTTGVWETYNGSAWVRPSMSVPRAQLYQSVAQTGLASGWQKIVLDAERVDSHNGHPASGGAGWTCPVGEGGDYAVSATLWTGPFSSNIQAVVSIRVNNVGDVALIGDGIYGGGSGPVGLTTGTKIVTLVPGDVVNLYGLVAGNGWMTTIGADATSSLSIFRVA